MECAAHTGVLALLRPLKGSLRMFARPMLVVCWRRVVKEVRWSD